MRRARWAVGLAFAGAVFGLFITRPAPLSSSEVAALPVGNAVAGEQVFWAAGCASCHAAPAPNSDNKLVLAGGLEFKTEFGTFVAPNISSSADNGIGAWPLGSFASAILKGVSPDGEHYYPSFPYGSYARMTSQDISDLYAFMKTLPASENQPAENQLKFPFNIRASVGGWKLLFFTDSLRVKIDPSNAVLARGQYLVEGPGHCGECHTPRNLLGGFQSNSWLSGAKNPDGAGTIPNITLGSKTVGAWSEADLVAYFETGFTPDFDSVGGSMVSVQSNLSKLPKSDLEAIAAYLKAIPAHTDGS